MRFESVFGFGFGGAFTLFADCLNTLALGQKKARGVSSKMMIVFARRAFRLRGSTSASEERNERLFFLVRPAVTARDASS
jgi:hypothetical protein